MVAINLGSRPGATERGGSTLELMKAARRWLIWRYGPLDGASANPKRPKRPSYVDGGPREGRLDTDEDRSRLASFMAATQAVNRLDADEKGVWRLGFALGPDEGGGYWQGFDRDGDKVGAADWKEGYVETSPSGAGYHVVGYGRAFRTYVNHPDEFYSHGRFFTFTGEQLSDGPVVDLFDRAGGIPPAEALEQVERPVVRLGERDLGALRSALRHLDPEPYDVWYRVALALRQVENGADVFLEWSRGSAKHRDRAALRKLDGAAPYMPWQAVLAMAKEAGWKQERAAPEVTFLPRVEVDVDVPLHTEFVLDGFIQTGSMVVVGLPGVGKTSVLLPVAMGVAHLLKRDFIRPRLRRRVFYVTEDERQLRTMIRGLFLSGKLAAGSAEVNEWLHVIPTRRASPEAWEEHLRSLVTGKAYEADFGRGPFVVEPLVILDTTSATIEIDSENDNASVSRAVSAVRRAAGAASVWFVTHSAKATRGADPEDMSARGAGAWTGDTQGELIIFQTDDPDTRGLKLGKVRFVSDFSELKVRTDLIEEKVEAPWGDQIVRHRVMTELTVSSVEERRREAKQRSDDSKLMSAHLAFKRLMEMATAGLAVPNGPGVPKPPEGYGIVRLREDLLGLATNRPTPLVSELRAELVRKLRPREEGNLLIVDKGSFNVGKKE